MSSSETEFRRTLLENVIQGARVRKICDARREGEPIQWCKSNWPVTPVHSGPPGVIKCISGLSLSETKEHYTSLVKCFPHAA